MITGQQIREARRLLNWAQWRLAKKTDLAMSKIARVESKGGESHLTISNLAKIAAVLKAAGVEFSPDGHTVLLNTDGRTGSTSPQPARRNVQKISP